MYLLYLIFFFHILIIFELQILYTTLLEGVDFNNRWLKGAYSPQKPIVTLFTLPPHLQHTHGRWEWGTANVNKHSSAKCERIWPWSENAQQERWHRPEITIFKTMCHSKQYRHFGYNWNKSKNGRRMQVNSYKKHAAVSYYGNNFGSSIGRCHSFFFLSINHLFYFPSTDTIHAFIR
jgi:hypothetical protein